MLFISHRFYPDIGGIEVNSEILATYFSKFGAKVHLVTWSGRKGKKNFPFEVIRNPSLKTLFKAHKWADVVYENNPTLRLSWPKLLFQKPHVVAIRTWIGKNDSNKTALEKLKLNWVKQADKAIAVSNKVRQKTVESAEVIPNPYRSDLFYQLSDLKKEKDFAFLGRLVSDKGADMAIELLKKVHSAKANSYDYQNLTIIGDGPEKDNLLELVKRYNLSKYVGFTGFLEGENLNKELNRHKYLLVPSRWEEPFGNVALEGMACGCLSFVSDGGGLPEAVGEAGVVFERNNVDSLYQAVKKILENPDLENELRSNAEEHLNKHKPEVIAEKYFNIIQESYQS